MLMTLTPLSYPQSSTELLRKLKHLPLPVLLSSGGKDRFDIISAAPEAILRSYLKPYGLETVIKYLDGGVASSTLSPFSLLKEQFNEGEFGVEKNEDLPFTGGALGYFSYELLHAKLGIQSQAHPEDPALPEMLVGIYHWAIIVDHHKQCCTLVSRSSSSLKQEDIIKLINKPVSNEADKRKFTLTNAFESNFTKKEYQQVYDKVIDYIYAGDCYQVNLAQRFSAPYQGDTFEAFETLNDRANAPFSAYLEDGQQAVLSFSPERFLKVHNKQVVTEPIKGTRPRHEDPVQDSANLDELTNSDKDKAENLMIVDLLRNDLGRVCKTGSVSVEGLFKAHSFTNVHHLISTIKGELNNADEVFELLEASFPGGSITGTPKIRSMEIINELETRSRSVYCGSMAYIDFNGEMDSSICIRSLVCDGTNIHCWGGGAVVADSTMEQEYQETIDKISLFMDGLTSG